MRNCLPPWQAHTQTYTPCCSEVKRLIESYGGGNNDGWLSLKKAEPGDSWDNKLWMRPPLPSAPPSWHSFQFLPPPSSPQMSFNETPPSFVAFSLPLCFSLAILLSDLRNSMCFVPIDWSYKECALSDFFVTVNQNGSFYCQDIGCRDWNLHPFPAAAFSLNTGYEANRHRGPDFSFRGRL